VPWRRNEMKEGCGHALALAVLLAVLAACSADPEPTDPTTPSQVASSQPASATEGEDPEAPTGAFFLDLRTGEQTRLPSTGAENYGAPFDDGHYYAASPDGSTVIYEDACCSADDVAAEASSDGSQGGRLDPAGPINYYAGGWSPDGTKIVYQRRDGSGSEFGDLFVEDMGSGRRTRITDLELGSAGWWYLAPIFSLDGRKVIFQLPRDPANTKWDLWSVPATGGEPTLLVRNAAQAAAFGGPIDVFVRPMPDSVSGSRLVIATSDGVRTLVEATSSIDYPRVSPDWSRIAYADAGSIHVVDVSTGESTEVADGRMAAWLDDDTLIVAPEKP
jgi:hypothetical protein